MNEDGQEPVEPQAPNESAVAIDAKLIEQAQSTGAAWAPAAPSGDAWTARPWVHPSARLEQGRLQRKRVPRTSHAAFEPRAGRDPIAILDAQEADRLQDLVPLRHARMAESPFAYYRGTPAVMAFDLATTPRTDIIVQASGDAHLSNFGLFASPERTLMFDSNDFDETLPAPWEWDVKRLAASIVIAGRANGFTAAQNRTATMATVRSYREWMARYAAMRLIDVWYSHITSEDIKASAEPLLAKMRGGAAARAKIDALFTKARGRDALRAAASLTTVVDGRRMIIDQPPLIQHVEIPGGADAMREVFEQYRATMAESRREFLERYRFADFALKVVGVGSVGTRCFVMVLEGRDQDDPLILQAKEATASVLEAYAGASRVCQPRRARRGRPAADAGDAGHLPGLDARTRGPGLLHAPAVGHEGLRRDQHAAARWASGSMAASAPGRLPAHMPEAVTRWRSPPTSAPTDTFDGAIADFAETYADVNEADHRIYVQAIKDGRISVPPA